MNGQFPEVWRVARAQTSLNVVSQSATILFCPKYMKQKKKTTT